MIGLRNGNLKFKTTKLKLHLYCREFACSFAVIGVKWLEVKIVQNGIGIEYKEFRMGKLAKILTGNKSA